MLLPVCPGFATNGLKAVLPLSPVRNQGEASVQSPNVAWPYGRRWRVLTAPELAGFPERGGARIQAFCQGGLRVAVGQQRPAPVPVVHGRGEARHGRRRTAKRGTHLL